MKKIILASSSPRRQALLQGLGVPFEVQPPDFDEASVAIADPHRLPVALALGKAMAVARKIPGEGAWVIGADTIVHCDGEIFGKPRNAGHAKEMLKKLNGKEHAVVTGIAIYDTDTHRFLTDTEETAVRFLPLSEAEIDAYIKSGEPFGKAGGYAIQGLAAFFVGGIEGDYDNVVGLPMAKVKKLFGAFGSAADAPFFSEA